MWFSWKIVILFLSCCCLMLVILLCRLMFCLFGCVCFWVVLGWVWVVVV